MASRAYNFNAGPAAIPLEVLEQAREELMDYKGAGMSIMEMSHRSKEYEELNSGAQQLFTELLGLPADFKVLFLQGGASTQFAMVPLNLLRPGSTAAYVVTGSWAEKALAEAKLVGDTFVAAETSMRMPSPGEIHIPGNLAYLHMTSNETISGSQFTEYPDTGKTPLVADMSSDIMSKPIDVSKFDLIYAGAQKNLGPSGVTVALIREALLQDIPKTAPTMLRYDVHAKNDSLYNTPPSYSVYMVNLVLQWIRSKGGLAAMDRLNRDKAGLIYQAIDESGGFYEGMVEPASRSLMNITFKLADGELEKKFIRDSEHAGFVGLKGHRSVGHLRASTYNAVPYESCKALRDFMLEFMRTNG